MTASSVQGVPSVGAATLASDASETISGAGGQVDMKGLVLPPHLLTRPHQSLRIRGWGRSANNANGKTVTLKLVRFDGANTLITLPITASALQHWLIDCTLVVRTPGSAQFIATAQQGPATATQLIQSGGSTLAVDLEHTLVFQATQAAAGDLIQNFAELIFSP